MPGIDIARSLANLKLERDAVALYDALAGVERDQRRADAFHQMASTERRHAEIWARRLESLGAEVPPAGPPRARVRLIILLARAFGTPAVSGLVKALEGDESDTFEAQAGPELEGIAADERENARTWRRLDAERRTAGARETVERARRTANGDPSAAKDALASGERWHRSSRSGTLRAVIFGISDGLVSNLSLVMGVAGASENDPRFILLAGLAGLLAGAFSMAAGEYISMQSQRELFEYQIELERAELEIMPEAETAELEEIYRRKGFTGEEAARAAERLAADPEKALDTLVREELGLDPDELGSPWRAAAGSFVAFAIGAIVPVVPFLFADGTAAFVVSVALSSAALFGVGAAVSLVTGRSFLFSGLRQLGLGGLAAAVTYGVGLAIGVSVGG